MNQSGTTFGPCHTINLVYPALNDSVKKVDPALKYGRFVGWSFLTPDNLQQRRKPQCLVPDPDVRRITSRMNAGEVSFFHVFKATKSAQAGQLTEQPVFTNISKFIDEVQRARHAEGSSELLVDIAEFQQVDGNTTKILHIEWRLTSRNMSNQIYNVTNRLVVPYCEEVLTEGISQEQWYLDIGGLVRRTSDRAVRHVDFQLRNDPTLQNHSELYVRQYFVDLDKRIEVEQEKGWQIDWQPPYREVLSKFMMPTTHAGGQVPYCRKNFNASECIDGTARETLKPENCHHERHYNCFASCFHYISTPDYDNNAETTKKGPRVLLDPSAAYCHWCKVSRPYPRNPLLSREVAWKIAAGVEQDGKTYLGDAQLSEWENMERSYADLDRKTVQEDRKLIGTYDGSLLQAWKGVVEHACREPETSTPKHLNPTNWPEFAIVDSAFNRFFAGNGKGDAPSTRKATYNLAMDDVLEDVACEHIFANPDFKGFLSDEVRTKMHNRARIQEVVEHILRRPGLKEFVNHCLRRTIRYQTKRLCFCDEDKMKEDYEADLKKDPSLKSMKISLKRQRPFTHKHGLREYYSNLFLDTYRRGKYEEEVNKTIEPQDASSYRDVVVGKR